MNSPHNLNLVGTTGGIKNTTQKAASSKAVESLTRVGFGVRGLIYIMMGLIAVGVAFGNGGTVKDPQGTIEQLGAGSGGGILLWIILVGLFSYSLWGVIRALFDPLHKGTNFKGIVSRISFLISAVSYIFLGLLAYGIITGSRSAAPGSGGSNSFLSSITSSLIGQVAVAVLAAIVVIIGLFEIYQGFSATFDKQFAPYAMPRGANRFAIILGRVGTATRGIIFILVGGALGLAAFNSTTLQNIGIDSALASLQGQPYGIYLLGLIAFGLIAFGLFSVFSALYFRMQQPRS